METRLPLLSLEEQRCLFGPYDRHVKQASRRLGVRMSARDGSLRLTGPDDAVAILGERIEAVLAACRAGGEPGPAEVEEILFGAGGDQEAAARRAPAAGGLPAARTAAQRAYLDAIAANDLVLAAGPAGTGKTFLAVAAAVRELRGGRVQRLVLTRPAVEAGERLGFLPGDFEAKVNPYLRPLYDALRELIGPTGLRRLRSLDLVEIAPLAFMRGRTLARSFIILDEAQNCTPGQMKMFLTRLGQGSKAVVTGDLSQTDLVAGRSGLQEAISRLEGVAGVGVVRFGNEDIQRSDLVQRVVEAWRD